MRFLKEEIHHKTRYTLTIDDSEIVTASILERDLLKKCSESEKISDNLLALELIVQKIEHAEKWEHLEVIMQEKVKEVQDYLEKQGIVATETSIVNAAINIATRWGGNRVFICEFERRTKR